MVNDAAHSVEPMPAGLGRRFGAIGYDALLLVAVLFVGTAVLLPFTGGEAIRAGDVWYTAYLVALSFGYFGWFWTHGGQTLGMRSWRLRLVGANQDRASWRQALVRFVSACFSWLAFGAGFVWLLVDPDRLTWHDRASRTRIVHVS
jgi:uncharacterized RDD family membrane protein YckC